MKAHNPFSNPVRLIPLLFLAAIAVGAALLSLPIASAGPESASPLVALFTATSAVAVTGLITVDTATYWSGFGQAVILALFQIGGFGIVTAAVLLGMLAGRDFRLRDRLITHTERSRLTGTDTRSVLLLALAVTLVIELAMGIALALRLHLAHGETWGTAAWNGIFHSVSAFNNAGFSTYSDSVMGFQADPLILGPIMLAVMVSSLGFPVLQDLRRRPFSFRSWSLHSKITLIGTATLLVGGFIAITIAEWANPDTLGPLTLGQKLLNGAFHSAMPRTAGFNSLDVGAFRSETLTFNYFLMFVGGGSAGTAGGIKVTTFVLLLLAVWSEIRGQRDVTAMGRRVSTRLERQALSVAMIAALLITIGTVIILSVTPLPLSSVLFEAISAFSTVGLSTGITADLPPVAQLTLIVLMYVGRVGTITVATALALSANRKPIRFPEENPIVG